MIRNSETTKRIRELVDTITNDENFGPSMPPHVSNSGLYARYSSATWELLASGVVDYDSRCVSVVGQ